jgi:hypothetical protein
MNYLPSRRILLWVTFTHNKGDLLRETSDAIFIYSRVVGYFLETRRERMVDAYWSSAHVRTWSSPPWEPKKDIQKISNTRLMSGVRTIIYIAWFHLWDIKIPEWASNGHPCRSETWCRDRCSMDSWREQGSTLAGESYLNGNIIPRAH